MPLLLLVKYTESVKFNSLLFPHYYFTTVNAFPCVKVKKVVKERLEDHKPFTFSALHILQRSSVRLLRATLGRNVPVCQSVLFVLLQCTNW